MYVRKRYLDKLISRKWNGMVKIITGIRRCGKSVLLFNLYYDYLIGEGVPDENIIKIRLDERTNVSFRNPNVLCDYVKDFLNGKREKYYIFIDEIQLIEPAKVDGISSKIGIYEVLNELNGYENLDVYVTGSNSKMLSSDIATEFRGRGDVIRVHPLSYAEFLDAFDGDKQNAWNQYFMFGGMPFLLSLKKDEEKSDYLKRLLDKVYISDVIERNGLKKGNLILGELLDIVASSVGSLTSPTKLSNAYRSKTNQSISTNTIFRYIDFFIDAFLIGKSRRFEINGKGYIDSPAKYYFEDIGLRNARLDFKEQDVTHIMENVIYNELVIRGFNVDVGVIEHFFKNSEGKNERAYLKIDFICNKGFNRYYIQSAYAIPDTEKRTQETRGFLKINDSYQKIVIVREDIIPWKDENGIMYIGIEKFLLDESLVN
ncbi:MAG: ATP-binding protein [Clostridiales bacterium]|nr:ATP-binding protein [Clostridiales bacterium]